MPQQETPRAPAYTCDPALAALFAPRQPFLGHYEVCTAPEPIGDEQGEALEALDAFGTAGSYKRSVLARYSSIAVIVTNVIQQHPTQSNFIQRNPT